MLSHPAVTAVINIRKVRIYLIMFYILPTTEAVPKRFTAYIKHCPLWSSSPSSVDRASSISNVGFQPHLTPSPVWKQVISVQVPWSCDVVGLGLFDIDIGLQAKQAKPKWIQIMWINFWATLPRIVKIMKNTC